MYAVVARSTIKDFEQARKFLREEGIPRLSQMPGFISGHWVRLGEKAGASMILFESEEAARRRKSGLRRTYRLRSCRSVSRLARFKSTRDLWGRRNNGALGHLGNRPMPSSDEQRPRSSGALLIRTPRPGPCRDHGRRF